jgi:hypothetical protein
LRISAVLTILGRRIVSVGLVGYGGGDTGPQAEERRNRGRPFFVRQDGAGSVQGQPVEAVDGEHPTGKEMKNARGSAAAHDRGRIRRGAQDERLSCRQGEDRGHDGPVPWHQAVGRS